ncbi:phasin family protein [Accumulibacter sp.]|uniref:phasin family protein n=1 Tax=Accumulibacter sp. TaxID=2053492 RepID=UPI0028C47122|nr:phasin family protein [Accumulibacter sp.]
MYNLAEQFTKTNMAGLEALKSVVNASFDGMGKLAALNLHTARAVAARNAESFKALAGVKDLAGLKALQHPMAISAVSQSVAYSRRAYQICNESSSAVTQVFGSQLSQAGRGAVGALAEGKKKASPVLDLATGSGKMLMAMARSAYANVGQLTAPVTEKAPTTAVTVGKPVKKTA